MASGGKANGRATVSAVVSSKVPASATSHPLAEEPSEIASNINYHAQYGPHFSLFKFEPEQAFCATAKSVRDRLIHQWNETYLHFSKVDPKQTYYLSMEYLQGRALTNAIGNLGIKDAYADALNKLGHELEEIVEKLCLWCGLDMASAGKGKEIDVVQVEPITSETSKEVFLVLSLPTAEEKRLVPQICNRLKAQGCKVTLIADPGLNYLDVALLGRRLEVEVLEIPLSPAQPGSDLSTLIAQGLKSILLSRSQDPVLKLPDLAVIGSGMEAAVEIFSEFGIETLSMLVTQGILTYAASFLAVGPQTLDPEIIRSASTYQDGGVSRNLDLIGNSDPQHTVVKEDEVFQWLDSQPAARVVYVRFGANIYNDKWANALEASDVPFVWNVGPPSEYDLEANESNLPFGLGKKFGDRVRFISGPAPEASFLSHKSIGLLVTQCDFGTVYEGIKCGVPILVLSCKDDQFCASEKMLKYSGAGMVLPYFTKKDDIVKGIECVLKNKGMKKRAAALGLAFWGVHCLIGALLKTSLPGKRIKALAFKMFK